MRIYLDGEIYSFLKNFRPSPNLELEIRFGKLVGKEFRSNISESNFNKLSKKLENIYRYKDENTKVELYPNKIRKVIADDYVVIEKKQKVYNRDLEFKDFSLRFVLSEEIPAFQNNLGNPIDIRYRKRRQYYGKDCIYVLTKIEKNGSYSYEFEIEYYISKVNLGNILESLNNVLDVFVPELNYFSYLSIGEQNFIRKLFKKYEIKESKPRNLPREETHLLQQKGYSVTNKLDGERFFIFMNKYGLYSINNRIIEKVIDVSFENDSILDTEFFGGMYHVFDCLISKNRDVRKTTHLQRIEFASELVNVFPKILKMKVFSSDIQTYTSFLLKTLDRKINDGLIFTPNTDYNSYDIFKWKFVEKMSIDFYIKNIGEKIYQLYVQGEDDVVLFKGSDNYPMNRALYKSDKEYKDGIYEFGYDNEKHKFVMFRERPDKVRPNFYKVAMNIWNDIRNPFTDKELVQLLSETYKSRVISKELEGKKKVAKLSDVKENVDIIFGFYEEYPDNINTITNKVIRFLDNEGKFVFSTTNPDIVYDISEKLKFHGVKLSNNYEIEDKNGKYMIFIYKRISCKEDILLGISKMLCVEKKSLKNLFSTMFCSDKNCVEIFKKLCKFPKDMDKYKTRTGYSFSMTIDFPILKNMNLRGKLNGKDYIVDLLREFYFGYKYFNKICDEIPNFIKTYGIVKYNENIDQYLLITEDVKMSTPLYYFITRDLPLYDTDKMNKIIVSIVLQLVFSLYVLEKNGVYHNDIVNSNILIQRDNKIKEINYRNESGSLKVKVVDGLVLRIIDYGVASTIDKEYCFKIFKGHDLQKGIDLNFTLTGNNEYPHMQWLKQIKLDKNFTFEQICIETYMYFQYNSLFKNYLYDIATWSYPR